MSALQEDIVGKTYEEFRKSALTDANKLEFKSLLEAKEGLSSSDTSLIPIELEILFNIKLEDLVAKEEAIADVETTITARQKTNAVKEKEIKDLGTKDLVSEGHLVQDSATRLTRDEPIAPDTGFTAPIDIQQADYSIAEDYPDTYGFVDSVKNWFKINKKLRHAEFVHSSGTMLKCDRDGNTTIEVKGKLKFIQRGEVTHFIGDNLDIAIDGSFYHHIMGELKQMIDGDSNIKVGGNSNIKVGGNLKITASRIDLN